MKTFFLSLALAIFCVGCAGTGKVLPSVVQRGVATGVAYSVVKYPAAVPFLRAAAPVVCSVANGTNLAPADVIRAIELSDAALLKTPEGVLILNGALLLYTSVWQSYGANAANNATSLRPYLQATCDGLISGLPTTGELHRGTRLIPPADWPHVEMP